MQWIKSKIRQAARLCSASFSMKFGRLDYQKKKNISKLFQHGSWWKNRSSYSLAYAAFHLGGARQMFNRNGWKVSRMMEKIKVFGSPPPKKTQQNQIILHQSDFWSKMIFCEFRTCQRFSHTFVDFSPWFFKIISDSSFKFDGKIRWFSQKNWK